METGSSPPSPRSLDNPRVQNQESTRVFELAINGQEEAGVSGQAVNSNIVLHDTGLAGAVAIPVVGSDDADEDADAIPAVEPVDADEVTPGQNAANGSLYAPPAPRTGVRSVCGRRKEMEDAVSVVRNFLTLPAAPQDTPSPPSDLHFYAVYDGHGGAQAAIHCREHLHLALAEEMMRGPNAVFFDDMQSWQSAMKATFLRMDGEVGSHANTDQQSSTSSDTVGSTAIVAVLSGRNIIVANCGDSRAVLCRRGQAIALSEDHKPEREDEMARIEAAGGRVICWNGWRVLGVLAMSRAIGDHFLKPYVIADPDITMTARSEEDECLILASDGLWDVLSNQDACTIARRCLAANREVQVAASALTHTAHEKGSSDNISVVVVDLRPHVRNGVFT